MLTELAPGVVLAERYSLVRRLGRGAAGEVWSAEDQQLGETVAIKLLTTGEPDAVGSQDQLTREVRLARRVTHRNVCRLHDVHLQPQPFVSMELLQGETLEELLERDGPQSVERARSVLRQLASGLAAAHGAGVVHRDLKSSNIVLVEDGQRPVICDFGLSSIGGEAAVETEAVVGTPVTVAPETARGEASTSASDLYAFGVVAFQLLTGELPFAGPSVVDAAALEAVVARLERAGVPRHWRQLVAQCLDAEPEARPTAEAVRRALTPRPRTAGRLVVAAGLVVVVAIGVWRSWANPVPRPSVAVLPLGWSESAAEADHERPRWLPLAVSELVAAELAATGAVCVLDRQRTVEVAVATRPDDDQQRRMHGLQRRLAADMVLTGTVSLVDERLKLQLRLIGPDAVTVTGSAKVAGDVDDLGAMTARAVAKLVRSSRMERSGDAELSIAASAIEVYSRGLAALRAGEIAEARRMLEEAVTVDPDSPLLRVALARAMAAEGAHRVAAAQARQAVELAGDCTEELRLELVGLAALLGGDPDGAVAACEAWCQRAPDSVEARLQLVRSLIAAGHGGEALRAVQTARQGRQSWRRDLRLQLEGARAASVAGLFEQQLEMARALEEAAQSPMLRAQAQLNQGQALLRLGRSEAARVALQRALGTFTANSGRAGVAQALNSLAVLASRTGRLEEAELLYRRSLAICEQIGDRSGVAHALRNLGIVARRRGDMGRAVAAARQSLMTCRELGDDSGIAVALVNLAVTHRARGELEKAEQLFREALDQRRAMAHDRGCAVALVNLGNVLLQQGQLGDAAAAFAEAEELALARNDRRTASHALFGHAMVHWYRGAGDAANEAVWSARRLRHGLNDAAGCAATDILMAQMALENGHCRRSAELAGRAATALCGDRDHDLGVLARAVIVRALVACGDLEEADRWMPKDHTVDSGEVRIEVLRAQADLAWAGGDLAAAEEALTAAVDTAARNGEEIFRLEGMLALGRLAAARGAQLRAESTASEVVEQARRLGVTRVVFAAQSALGNGDLERQIQ